MTCAKDKGGFGSFVSNYYEKAMIPTLITGGKVLHKAGSFLNN